MEEKFQYFTETNKNETFYIKKGQVISGYTIGILLLDVWYPLLPGNVVNASTFNFPVRHKLIPNATQERIHNGDPLLQNYIIQAAKDLESEGVRAICGACGYLGNYQKEVKENVSIPIFLSSLVQLPLISTGIKEKQKIGILCADKRSLTPELLQKCGMHDLDKCIIEGVGDKPEFASILNSDRGFFDNNEVRKEVVEASQDLTRKYPEIGAILLECSDMPPYSMDVQRATGLPVFDFITLINLAHQSVTHREYFGFI